MAERGSDRPIKQFGDVDVTVLLDMSVPFTGLETVTAHSIQRIVDQPGDGTCSVRLQRLGVDASPQPVTRIVAQDLRASTGPMRWVNWWKNLPIGPRHIVVLAIHELRGPRHVENPKGLRLLPLALAIGVAPDLVTKFSSIPASHTLHVPVDRLASGWEAVYRSIDRVRCIPNVNDPRTLHRLAFEADDRELKDPQMPQHVYLRHAGFGELARLMSQHTSNRVHTR